MERNEASQVVCPKCKSGKEFHIFWSDMIQEVRPKEEFDVDDDTLFDSSKPLAVADKWSEGHVTGGRCDECGYKLTKQEAEEIYQQIDFDYEFPKEY